MNELLSKSIRDLRFPLAVLIVFKHYYTPDISAEALLHASSFYFYLGNTISHVITGIAVPIFFFISGYLYFIKTDMESGIAGMNYLKKTKSRIKSLLIPYLSWNVLVMLFYSGMALLTSGDSVMEKDGYKSILEYTLTDVWKSIYALDTTGMPMDGPLWFIRDLFVISLFSPLVFLIVRYLKWVGVLALGCLMACHIGLPFEGFSTACWFYFSWGAYMGLNKSQLFSNVSDRTSLLMNGGILVLMVSETICYFNGIHLPAFIMRAGSVFLIFGAMAVYERKSTCRWQGVLVFLSTSSFFVYAIHKPLQVIIRRFAFKFLQPDTDLLCCSLNILIPLLTIVLSLAAFYIIKRYLPCLKFLNGFRL
ncbi:MAG: acyltransferase [Prevotellaceae bacterium]|nr:acyltransferase [Prevotellaceae bacterium]